MKKGAIKELIATYEHRLGDNDFKFLSRVYGEGAGDAKLGKYRARLEQINFVGNHNVLDFGCGFGQWSVALSGLNQNVVAFEPDELRSSFLRDYVSMQGISNIVLSNSENFLKEQSDASFDAVFCYGVIFLTDWKNTLQEFHRILSHGGSLYLCANDIGWYVYLWETCHNQADDFDVRQMVSKTFTNTVLYDSENYFEKGMKIITPKISVTEYLNGLEFSLVDAFDEGSFKHPVAKCSGERFFDGKYAGLPSVYEIYAQK
ncbi:MAG: class I SAM-dependent methyltransferase [Paracoccaceae bacterium]